MHSGLEAYSRSDINPMCYGSSPMTDDDDECMMRARWIGARVWFYY